MKKIALVIVVASYPVGLLIGFYVVERVWAPPIGAKGRFALIFLFGFLSVAVTVGPLLLFHSLYVRKMLDRAKGALAAGDVAGAYRTMQLLRDSLLSQDKKIFDDAIELLKEIYGRAGIEVPLDEISRLFHEHATLYSDHKNIDGGVDDEMVSAELKRLRTTAQELIKELPAVG